MIRNNALKSLKLFSFIFVLGFTSLIHANEERYQNYEFAVIQALNKITAKTSLLKIKIDDTVELEKLNITPKTCKKTPPQEAPETIAFLEIDQLDNEYIFSKRLFSGWIFASSPALSALEHPIIDIKLLDCEQLIVDEEAELSKLYIEDHIQDDPITAPN